MSNWNLDNFNDIYATLAQSAYTGRPIKFPYSSLRKDQQKALDSGQSIRFDFSQDVTYKGQVTQGASGDGYPDKSDPNASKTELYLQPDETLHTEKEKGTYRVPDPNGGYHDEEYETGKSYQKGLLTDEKEGFNAYYVTDTQKVDSSTKNTYFVVRGSDGMGMDTLNDWIGNDAKFAVTGQYIPQAKLANKAMKEKIAELAEASPKAKMNVTGHSLGTIVSAQAVANLSYDELDHVGKVVLFDGPDVSDSLKKMDGVSDKKIQEAGKHVTYYVNPFDIVSMLNRDKPWKDQFGNVKVIVPSKYTGTFDGNSAHDFGAFQIDSHGDPLVASKHYHPELLKAGHDLAKLEKKCLNQLLGKDVDPSFASAVMEMIKNGVSSASLAAALGISVAEAAKVISDFQKEYQAIIDKAKKDGIKWSRDNINSFHDKIKQATGAQRILLRTELLYMATQLAEEDVTNKVEAAKKHISDVKDEVKVLSEVTIAASKVLGAHLSGSEIEELTAEIEMSNVWDEGTEEADKAALDTYKNKLSTFSSDLVYAAQNIEAVDAQQAGDIFANLSQ